MVVRRSIPYLLLFKRNAERKWCGIRSIVAGISRDFREGDVRHSQVDISKIQDALGVTPQFDIIQGIEKAMPWDAKSLA